MLNLKRILLFSFLLSGFAALVYEVVWTQLLTLSFGASAYSFSLMLAAFFIGLGLGGYAAGKYIDGKKDAVKIFAYLEMGIGLSGLVILLFFDRVGTPLSVLYRISGSFYLFMASVFFLSFLLMLVPTTLMGATLPVVSRIYADKKDSVGKDIGSVYSFNTFGAIFGSFAAGFILIPAIGLAKTTIMASAVNIFAAFLAFSFSKRDSSSRFYATFLAAVLIVLYMSSLTVQPIVTDVYRIARGAAEEQENSGNIRRVIIYYESNAYGTVAVTDKGSYRSLWINNKVDASTFPQDMSTQLLLGYLPMFANPEAKKVLNIGLGGGFTLGAIEAFNASDIDVIELNPLVVEATGKHFREFNGNALEDGRIDMIIADARNYLLTSDEKYDVIISEPSNLWVPGESGLFTKEHYLIVREHLDENGVFSQWFPLYDFDESETKVFLKTIKEVFPQVTLWMSGSDGIVIASREPVALNYAYIIRMLNQSKSIKKNLNLMVAGDLGDTSDEYREILPENYLPDELAKTFALSDEDVDVYSEKASFHTDDYPVLEFNAARNFLFFKNKSSSIESIAGYANKNKDSKGFSPPVLDEEYREGDWLYLELPGVKINTGNWSIREYASFGDNRSSFNITTWIPKIKTFSEDPEDVMLAKNLQSRDELKRMLLAQYPSSDIIEFKKNRHNAYLVKYRENQRTKALIGWYCELNGISYIIDIDAYDESEIMRINNDVLCIHGGVGLPGHGGIIFPQSYIRFTS